METPARPTEEKRYALFLNALATFVPVIGLLSTLAYAAMYLFFGYWQMLAVAIASLVGPLVFVLGGALLRKGRLWPAAIVIMAAVASLFIMFAAFWTGTAVTPILLIGTWAAVNVVAMMGVPPGRRRLIGPVISIVASTIIIVFDNLTLDRLVITELNLLRWLLPLVILLAGALSLLLLIRGVASGRLFARLLISFLLIAFIPVAALGSAVTIERIQTDRQYAIDQLENAIEKKENAINIWMQGFQGDVILTARDVQTLGYMRELLTLSPGDNPATLEGQTTERFYTLLYQSPRLQELFLMNLDGIVVIDTISTYKGADYSDREFFQRGLEGLFINPPFYFRDPNEITIVISYPVLDRTGRVIGVVAGRANMRQFNMMVAATDPDASNVNFYLVESNYRLLTTSAIGAPATVQDDAIREAILSRRSGVMAYQNYRGTPVFSVYRWMPALDSVLIAELPQVIAYANVGALLRTNIGLSLVSAIIAVLGAYFTIRNLDEPLTHLGEVARHVAAGNLNVRAQIQREDELGILGQAMNDMTSQLQALIGELEQRVAERTRDLERRTVELQTAAEVARDASIAENLDELLNRAARLIRERFGFYHVGIFLVDENNDYAVLRAAGGEAGQLMLASKHKLRVGEVGIVGYVTKTGEPRIALDTGADAIHFRNPLLPYTHSEMALPLRIGERIIGALDVQSDKINAFDQNDITIMQVMADQLAVAIEKANLLQEVERSVAEMERSYREYTTRTWRAFLQQAAQTAGYRYDGIAPEPLSAPPPESLEALQKGSSVILRAEETKGGSILAVPIRLRSQTIGTLNLRFQGHEVPAETTLLVEEAANRLALALENARLVQDAQRLATREQQINLITSRVQQATDLEAVLKNTIRELGNALGVPRTFIQIGLMPTEEEASQG
ncbi:MAG: GAF domain-containing protein [Anaerolineales bacterium]